MQTSKGSGRGDKHEYNGFQTSRISENDVLHRQCGIHIAGFDCAASTTHPLVGVDDTD
jgi:hypothetical protein